MKARTRNRLTRARWHLRHTLMPIVFVGLLGTLAGGYSIDMPPPPRQPENLCAIFEEYPHWYDYARASEDKWGTPIASQMAFIYYESSFRSHIQPPRTRLYTHLPWKRPTTAYGYAQALDPAWRDYMAEAGSPFADRTQIRHAVDFIGWYNDRTHRQLGLPLTNARDIYLAYHEGPTGFRQGRHLQKPAVQQLATRVAARSARYEDQLAGCEQALRCRRFWQFGPFCS